jgi:hypothetical protein
MRLYRLNGTSVPAALVRRVCRIIVVLLTVKYPVRIDERGSRLSQETVSRTAGSRLTKARGWTYECKRGRQQERREQNTAICAKEAFASEVLDPGGLGEKGRLLGGGHGGWRWRARWRVRRTPWWDLGAHEIASNRATGCHRARTSAREFAVANRVQLFPHNHTSRGCWDLRKPSTELNRPIQLRLQESAAS